MPDTCPTVKIKADNDQGFIVINDEDFDPMQHAKHDESKPEEKPAKADKAPKAK